MTAAPKPTAPSRRSAAIRAAALPIDSRLATRNRPVTAETGQREPCAHPSTLFLTKFMQPLQITHRPHRDKHKEIIVSTHLPPPPRARRVVGSSHVGSIMRSYAFSQTHSTTFKTALREIIKISSCHKPWLVLVTAVAHNLGPRRMPPGCRIAVLAEGMTRVPVWAQETSVARET